MGGSFNEKYLDLPREILVTAMRSHQRYFSVIDKKGDLLPHFITVNNTKVKDNDISARGNERVLTARLEDARFYFEDDLKVPLKDRVDDLKEVIFHSKLGSSFDKVMRFRELAGWLSEKLHPELKEDVLTSSYLVKADLDTGIVKEFPTLQGIIGREYAMREGIKGEVADAIYEHYLPTSASGNLPEGTIGTIISIADRMDTISGFFGVGMTPTGTTDPYALRRNTIAIINIITGKGVRLSLESLIDKSIEILGEKLSRPIDEVKIDIVNFFRGRFSGLMLAEGFSGDVVDAVRSQSIDDLVGASMRVEIVSGWKKHPEFNDLTTSIKRVVNIIKDEGGGVIKEELLTDESERDLFTVLVKQKEKIEDLIRKEELNDILAELLVLKGPIDGFFDTVMVMDENKEIRGNRIALLSEIKSLFMGICDFSRIEQ